MTDDEVSDLELLAEYRAGNDDGFRVLYARHKDALFHHGRAILGDRGAAEDLVNEAFLELVRSADARRSPSDSFGPFLHRVLRRRAIDRLRAESAARRREEEYSREWVCTARTETDPLLVARVNAALASLPGEQLEAVLLHVYAGLTFEEAADVAEVSKDTLASRYRYALKHLASTIGGRL